MAPRPRHVILAVAALSLVRFVGVARGVVFAPYVDMTLYPPPNLTAIHRATGVRQLARFARSAHVGMLAMWELSRDHQCPHPVAQTQLTCSGVAQSDFQFARTLQP